MTNRLTIRLLALIFFVSTAIQVAPAQSAVKASTVKSTVAADADKLDINTAGPTQLKALKGVGDAYSKRIIDGRPYTAKNQLMTRGILPQATYDSIKDQIIARAVKK